MNSSQDKFAFSNISPRHRNINDLVSKEFNQCTKHQAKKFSILSQHCSHLELSIANIEIMASKLNEKCELLNRKREKQMLSNLKTKQNEFILSETKQSLFKQIKKNEILSKQLNEERRNSQSLRNEIHKLEINIMTINEKILKLESIGKEKQDKITKLTERIRLQSANDQPENRSKSTSKDYSKTRQTEKANQEYLQLENKLSQLERQFSEQMEGYQKKNQQLSKQLKILAQSLQSEKTKNLNLRKDIDAINISRYESQMKLKQQISLYTQLEDSYNKLMQKSTENQISLHQQIHNMRVNLSDEKKSNKSIKKQMKTYLADLAETLNNSKYYFSASALNEQVQQMKLLISKVMKKRFEGYTRQLQYSQLEISKLKKQIDEKNGKIAEFQKQSSMIRSENQKEKDTRQKNERSSQNGSFCNKSNQKSETDQKSKIRLENLRKDLRAKQNTINQLQKNQQLQFQKSKEKILQLQMKISLKTNEFRRIELQLKQKQSEAQSYISTIKQLESKVHQIVQKFESEKESQMKINDMKFQNYEQKLRNLKSNFKDVEKKQQDKTLKYNKLKSKFEKYEMQSLESLKRKNGQIDQMIKENNKLTTENKILIQKLNICQILEQQSPQPTINRDLMEQIQMERERIQSDFHNKNIECQQLKTNINKLAQELNNLKKQNKDLKGKRDELSKENRILVQNIDVLKQRVDQLENNKKVQSEENYNNFKKQLEKSVMAQKKAQRMVKEYASEKDQNKKMIDDQKHQIDSLKSNIEKIKDKYKKINTELTDLKQANKKMIYEYERKVSQCVNKEEQLINIINYKNRQGEGELRQSMKGEEILMEIIPRETYEFGMMTERTQSKEEAVNTSKIAIIEDEKKIQLFLPDQLILEQNIETDKVPLQKEDIAETIKINTDGNYFSDLAMQEQEINNNFQICEEGQEINIGQTAINLQIKQIFIKLRKEIEKVFNEQEFSLSMMKILPRQLEDDFNQFMAYIKEKIVQIKSENNLSFIMVEEGNEPDIVEDIDGELLDFVNKPSKDFLKMKKIIQEKQLLIMSLMNEKTEQQNTINQLTIEKQQVEEQNQNRFMNQCNIYKREIKENKTKIDLLEMDLQSIKNIFKNTIQIFVDQEENEDDLRDNLSLFAKIYRMSENEKQKLNFYIQGYKNLRKN